MSKNRNISFKISEELLDMFNQALKTANEDPVNHYTKSSIVTSAIVAFIKKVNK